MPLRDKLGLNKPKQPAQGQPPAKQPVPAARPGKPPTVGVEKVTCLCGHAAELELYPDKQDKFRDARRKKLAERACPDCRQKAHAEREAREKAEAAGRRKAKGPGRQKEMERLPDGSAFAVTYDAQAVKWSGTLTVPAEGAAKVFEGEAGAVFKLLTALDAQYRRWAAGQADPRAPSP
jgi:hypothetical protein